MQCADASAMYAQNEFLIQEHYEQNTFGTKST